MASTRIDGKYRKAKRKGQSAKRRSRGAEEKRRIRPSAIRGEGFSIFYFLFFICYSRAIEEKERGRQGRTRQGDEAILFNSK
jgi:hypothetical protein